MKGSMTPRRRSARGSTEAASSLAVAGRLDSSSRAERNSLPLNLEANNKPVPGVRITDYFQSATPSKSAKAPIARVPMSKKSAPQELETPLRLRTNSVSPSSRSRGKRPAIGMTDSASTTGSSKNIDNVFDTPICTPSYDSNPTSPEEEAYSPCDGRAGKDFLDRPSFQTTDEPVLYLTKKASRLSVSSQSPATAGQRSISAPSIAASSKPRSSSNPSVPSDNDDCVITKMKKLSLDGANDTRSQAAGRKTAPRARSKLGIEHRIRASSATGRIEENVKSDLGRRPETKERNMAYEDMDWEASFDDKDLVSQDTLRPALPARSSKKSVLQHQNSRTVLIDLTTPSSPTITPMTGSPKLGRKSPSVRQQVFGDLDKQKVHGVSGGETAAESRKDVLEDERQSNPDVSTILSGSEDEADLSDEHEDTPEAEAEGVSEPEEAPEVEDMSNAEDASDRNASSPEAGRPQESVDVEASEEPTYLHFFKKNDTQPSTPKDKQLELIGLIKAMKHKGKLTPRQQLSGFIYVYTSQACITPSSSGSASTYRYYKCGYCKNMPQARINAQKPCFPDLFVPEHDGQRRFDFAKLAEDLIHCELSQYKRSCVCKKCKTQRGHSTLHGEWFEVDLRHLMDVIEKWRSWIADCEPYTAGGVLRGRWRWKLDKLERSKGAVDLNSICHRFTYEEELSYRKDYIAENCKEYYRQGRQLHNDFMGSTNFWLVTIVFSFLIYNLGLWIGLTCFVVLACILMMICCG